ncbi:DUF3102 domain-containing protein [Gorillibacterium sp. CAU 1737]|uniref:DUF3102 domain-containing protein n=1 Tax=Gorillibacterium sp. CAU 1737 TaxID=3140362 RepID=UPI0032613998
MNELSLSSDLSIITAEINSYKQIAGQSLFEIGKRLKHVRDGLKYGQYDAWCEKELGFTRGYANRIIKAFDEFGTEESIPQLGMAKIMHLISLPETVDRSEFIAEPHTIPSTGETKTVDEMTVKELREVKKALKDAERRADEAQSKIDAEKNAARHYEKLWQQEKNQPPRVETRTVEVVPDRLKREMEEKDFQLQNLRAGYQEAKQKLSEYENRDTSDFDEEAARKEREKLQHEADLGTAKLRLAFKNFVEQAAVTSYLQGAIAFSNQMEKDRLAELVESAQQIIDQTKSALRGRKLGVVNE